MAKLQLIELVSRSPAAPEDVASVIPGPTSLWELFKSKYDPMHCLPHIILALRWDNEKTAPSSEKVLPSLASPPDWTARALRSFAGLSLSIVEKKLSLSHSESLIRDTLRLSELPVPDDVTLFQSYEFVDSSGAPDQRPELLESLLQVLRSELSSSVFDTRFIHAFVTPGNEELKLPEARTPHTAAEHVFSRIIGDLNDTPATWLERTIHMERIAPRSHLGTRESVPFVEAFQQFPVDLEGVPKFLTASLPPQARRAEGMQFSWFSSAGFCPMARSSLLPAFLTEADLEILIPSVPGRLTEASPPAGASIYFVGPFHRNNHWQQTMIQDFLKKIREEDSRNLSEVLHPHDSWLRKFAKIITKTTGWYSFAKDFHQFFLLQEGRGGSDYGIFFFSFRDPLKHLAPALRDQMKLLCLGKPMADSQKFELETSSAEALAIDLSSLRESLNVNGGEALKLEWRFSERMSPAYGFERASIFPDQFVLKTNFKSPQEVFLSSLYSRRPPSPRSERAPYRRQSETPKKFEKYYVSEGRRRLSAFAETGEEISENPHYSGVNLIDSVARKLLCGTRRVPRKAAVRLSISLPHEDSLTNGAGWAALVEAMEGIFSSLRAYEMSLFDVDISPYPVLSRFPELRAQADAPFTDFALPFDGFRMFDEVIFALGPKPAFVDVGSDVLNHVRVMSNYVTNIDIAKQMALYDLISDFMQRGVVLTALRVGRGGIVETLVDLGLKGQIGIQVRPTLSPVELFSGSPGRILVGVTPQDAKNFEKAFPSEYLSQIGTTHGQKILGAPLESLEKARMGKI